MQETNGSATNVQSKQADIAGNRIFGGSNTVTFFMCQ